MASKKKKHESGPVDSVQPENQQAVNVKEYCYVFRLSSEDCRVLNRYQDRIACAATGFAEIYYEYLFDSPDIAGMLHTYEKNGGDIGQWVRAQLSCLFDVFLAETDYGLEKALTCAGEQYVKHGFKPAWIVASYHLFIDYLKVLLPGLNLTPRHTVKLESVLTRLLFRNLGLVLEGYWHAVGKSGEKQLSRLERDLGRAEELLGSLPQMFWSVDVKRNEVVFANRSMKVLYGESPEVPIPCMPDICAEDQQKVLVGWQNSVSGSTSHAEVRMSLAGGEMHWYRVAFYPVFNRLGHATRIHCILEDINQLVAERRQLERVATIDTLTELPNRALWTGHLNMALAASRRVPGSQVVVISLNINQFKMYNDTLGQDVGDVLLHAAAERLQAVVRESDSLACLGGDQFAIMLQPASDAKAAAERVISQIMDLMDLPFVHQEKQLCIGVTLGVACFPEGGVTVEDLLGNAECAMQQARQRDLPYLYFDPLTDVNPVRQLRYFGQLQTALENDEFVLHYQPQLDFQTSRITGAEALIRWIHPLEGVVMPQRIIPVAEQLGMIMPLSSWVLLTALKQFKQWTFEGTPVPVSVNVSARTFHNPRLLETIRHALKEAGVEGSSLEIEVTEATLMQDADHAKKVLKQLSDTGVSVAIDDFGTGYSSLSCLKHLPVRAIKIDQSFLTGDASDQQDVAIVRSIIDLGHNLGCKVIAEGVENSSSWDMLNNLGCDTAQGFHISKPLPENQFSSLLSASTCLAE